MKYVPDYVVVPTFRVGDAMTRKRFGLIPKPLASYLPAKTHIFFLRDPWNERPSVRRSNSRPKRKYIHVMKPLDS